MAATVLASAPRPTRIVTPPTSTSIAPAPASDRHRGALRRPRRAGAFAATSTTAGTNCNSFVSKCFAADSLNWRRQPNNCCGDNPWRRATAQTESPLATISATIRPLSSSLHFRRRPAPVKTSSRRTGSVIALCTVSILSLTVKTKPQTRRSAHHPDGGRKTSLTIYRKRPWFQRNRLSRCLLVLVRDCAESKYKHCQDRDREAPEHGISVRANQDMSATEDQRSECQVDERH